MIRTAILLLSDKYTYNGVELTLTEVALKDLIKKMGNKPGMLRHPNGEEIGKTIQVRFLNGRVEALIDLPNEHDPFFEREDTD